MKNISKFLVVAGLLICSSLSAFANYSTERTSLERFFAFRGTNYESVLALAAANPELVDSVNNLYNNSYAIIDTLDGKYTFRGVFTFDGQISSLQKTSGLYFGTGVEDCLKTDMMTYVFLGEYPKWIDEINKCSGAEAKNDLFETDNKVKKTVKPDPIFGELPCRINGIQYAINGGLLYYLQKKMALNGDIDQAKCALNSDVFFKSLARFIEVFQTSSICQHAMAKPLIYGEPLEKAKRLKYLTENVPYLYFVSLKDGGTVKLDKGGSNAASLTATFQYSKDRKTWNDYTWPNDGGKGGAAITLTNAGDTVWFRAKGIEGKNATLTTSISSFFCFLFGDNDSIAAGGNIMSLYNDSCLQDTMTTYGFYSLFEGATQLVSAPRLPATQLADNCYNYMFKTCTALTKAPELKATTLTEGCYKSMFSYCIALTKAPELKATTLAKNCYNRMFYNCSSLEVDTCQNDAECKGALLVVPEPEPAPADWNKDMFKNCKGAYASNIQLGGHYCIKEFLPIQIDGKTYRTLAEAVAASQDGDTIILRENITITSEERAIIPGGVVLDNNKKTLTNKGKFGWDISEHKASMIDFKRFNDFGELDIVTSLDQPQDTVYKLAINTGSIDCKKFVLSGVDDKIDTLKMSGSWSKTVVYGHKIYQLHNIQAPAAKSEINAGFIIPSDTLYLYVYGYPRIEVMTESMNILSGYDAYIAEPYDWHGGAVYVYQRGEFIADDMTFTANSAALGGALYNTGEVFFNNVTFKNNTARMGGAIYNFSGIMDIYGTVTLATATDTWVNEGYKTGKTPQYSEVTWILGNTVAEHYGILNGYENYHNFGPYNKQFIHVSSTNALGTYTIATGDFSNVEGKDKFIMTGIKGVEDVELTIDGETKVYDKFSCSLVVNGNKLQLVVGTVNAKIDLAVTSMGKATIYSDKNLVVPAGVRVYGMKWDNNQGKLICTNADAYKAGDILPSEMGYLVEGAADTYSFYETDADANVIALSELSGVTVETATTDVEGTIFTLSNGYNGVGFYTFVGETLKANRAFYNSTNPNTKFYIGMDEAAGVESISSNSTNENMYNLQGVRVNENYKGVVIMNGKKVVK